MNHHKSNNPFVLGGVARGKQFAGRTGEIARLRGLAAEHQRVFVFAPRRYGKTSLLREAFEPEADAGQLLLLWCDCLPATDAGSFARRVAEAVVGAAKGKGVGEWIKSAAGLFARLRPTLSMGPDGEARVGIEMAGPQASPPADTEDALSAVGRLAESRRRPVVFVFDEFQQIAAWDGDHRTEAAIRTTIQDQPGVAYVFAGSERHLLEAMFSTRDRPLFKLAVPFPLNRLTDDELRPWLMERFGETGVALADDGLEAMLQIGHGHPWATQYLAHFVWNEAVNQEADVTERLVHEALRIALDVGDTIYDREFAALTTAQRQVFLAIATQPTDSPTAAAYLRDHRLPAKSTVSQALKALTHQGVIERPGETYTVSDPLFGEWAVTR